MIPMLRVFVSVNGRGMKISVLRHFREQKTGQSGPRAQQNLILDGALCRKSFHL
jgi:hypothetical protein